MITALDFINILHFIIFIHNTILSLTLSLSLLSSLTLSQSLSHSLTHSLSLFLTLSVSYTHVPNPYTIYIYFDS